MKDQFGSVYNSRGCFQIEGICFEDFLSFELFGDEKKRSNREKELGFAQFGGVDTTRQIYTPVVVVYRKQSVGRVAGFDRVGDPSVLDPVALIAAYPVLVGGLNQSSPAIS